MTDTTNTILRNTPNSRMAVKRIGEFRKELDRFFGGVANNLYSCGYSLKPLAAAVDGFNDLLADIERDLQSTTEPPT